MSVMDYRNSAVDTSVTNAVKAIIPLSVSQQFGVAIDPATNRSRRRR